MKFPLCTSLAILLLCTTPVLSQTNSNWTGATDQQWTNFTNWTPLLEPCNNGSVTYNVFIGGGAGTVFLNDDCTIENFTLQFGATLQMGDGDFLTVHNSINNGGVISPGGGGTGSGLAISDTSGDLKVTLPGTGEVLLDHPLDQVTGTVNHILVHDGSHTIHGHGNVGASQVFIENHGSIIADNSGNTLQVLPRIAFEHNGTLLATNGGILALNPATYTAHPSLSHFKVDDFSEIELHGITLDGGTFEAGNMDGTLNNNIVRTITNSTLKGTNNDARLVVNDGRTLSFSGGDIINNGLFIPDGATSGTNFSFSDITDNSIELSGNGRILLDNALDGITGTVNHTLIQIAPHAIEGGGELGRASISFINRISVTANQPIPLNIQPRFTWDNDGGNVTVATGSTAVLKPATYSCQNGGYFIIGDGSELELQGITALDSEFRADNPDTDLSNNLLHVTTTSTFNNCINNVTLRVDDNRTLTRATADFINNTAIHLDGSTAASNLSFSDTGDLQIQLLGTGTVFLDNAFDQVTGAVNHTLVQGPDHTIEGFGNIGLASISLVNFGAIDANMTGQTLTIHPRFTYLNDGGSLRVSNRATLHLNPGTYSVANGGAYLIGDACRLELDGVTMQGLTLAIEDLDLDPTNNDAAILTTSTFNNVVNETDLVIDNNRTLNLQSGDFTNNAIIRLDGTANATHLSFSDPSDLQIGLLGTGTVFLDNDFDRITGSVNHTLTHGPDHTIEGFGTIGLASISLVNQGLLDANVSGETLDIHPRFTFLNDGGTLQARNGATARLNAGTYSSDNGGTYLIADASTFSLHGVTFSDLTLDVDNLDLNLDNNAVTVATTSTFSNVVNHAAITADNNRTLNISPGDLTNHGTITLDSTGNATNLSFSDPSDVSVTLGGTGRVLLDHVLDRITGTVNHVLVHETSHTIEGGGNIGLATINLDNRGTITANLPATPLIIDDRLGGFLNSGTLQAVNGALLDIKDTFAHTSGLLFAETGATITVTGTIFQSGGTTRIDGDLSSTAFNMTGGVLQGTGLLDAPLTATTALVSPGNSTGTLTIDDDATLGAGSSLRIEINATADADQLVVNGGNLNLNGGALQLVYNGGPGDVLPADSFLIVSVPSSINNQFINAPDAQRLNTIDGSASFVVNYTSTTVTLTDFIYNPGGATNDPPVFLTTTTSYALDENSPLGTSLGTFSAYDPEGAVINYSLTPGAPFAIHPATGALTTTGTIVLRNRRQLQSHRQRLRRHPADRPPHHH
ncbi:MAG: hypothetical protein O3A87_02810 [Verrucomicrobia bacterium]|nr:hypothetical protein [Verrucomicrobiota bacterium]